MQQPVSEKNIKNIKMDRSFMKNVQQQDSKKNRQSTGKRARRK